MAAGAGQGQGAAAGGLPVPPPPVPRPGGLGAGAARPLPCAACQLHFKKCCVCSSPQGRCGLPWAFFFYYYLLFLFYSCVCGGALGSPVARRGGEGGPRAAPGLALRRAACGEGGWMRYVTEAPQQKFRGRAFFFYFF